MYCQLAALITPTGGKGAYNAKIITQHTPLVVPFRTDSAKTLWIPCPSNRGKWNRKRRATVRLQLTSFDYGSIFLSPPRRNCFNFANGRCERQGQSLLRVHVRSHKLDATATVK